MERSSLPKLFLPGHCSFRKPAGDKSCSKTWSISQGLQGVQSAGSGRQTYQHVFILSLKRTCLVVAMCVSECEIVQVADFGSARFATQEGYHFAEQHPPEKAGEVIGSLETMTVCPTGILILTVAVLIEILAQVQS